MAEFLAPFWEFLFDKLGIFGLLIAGSVPVILIILLIGFIGIIGRIRKAAKARKIKKLRRKIQTAIDDEEYETAFDLWQALGNQTPLTGDEQYRVGKLCEEGAAADWDKSGKPFEAITWYEKAARQGHLDAKYELLIDRLSASDLNALKTAKIIQEMRELNTKGCSKAKSMLQNVKTELDKERKAAYNRPSEMAASYGHADSQYATGIYWLQKGTKENVAEAVEWFYLAAVQGHRDAQAMYGDIYLFGKYGVKKDEKLGITWLTKAADQEHEMAQAKLGYFYSEEGPSYNLDKSIAWYQKASRNNNPDILYNMALMYLRKSRTAKKDERFGIGAGIGDTMTAHSIMERAAKCGSAEAKAYMVQHGIKSTEEILQEIRGKQ